MPILTLNRTERQKLKDLYFQAEDRGREYPLARQEIMTALRCLKAVHSNALEDKSIDRVFLQILLHDAGVEDKQGISPAYDLAWRTLKGQQAVLEDLEARAAAREPLSISLLTRMHGRIFGDAWPEGAGQLRRSAVAISGMAHDPPPASAVEELLHQRFASINEAIAEIGSVTPETFDRVLRLSAEAHYVVAGVHPFEDGNGRIARAVGDFLLLRFDMYYDVIMTEYRDNYLDSLEDCTFTDCSSLHRFLEFSYLETLQRVFTFYKLAQSNAHVISGRPSCPE
ncbi:Fic family protein [bacterium]|nr:Fic family protein [bacterium]